MIWGTNKKGLNIELTDLQYEYLHELVMFAYEMDTPCLLYTSPSPRD